MKKRVETIDAQEETGKRNPRWCFEISLHLLETTSVCGKFSSIRIVMIT